MQNLTTPELKKLKNLQMICGVLSASPFLHLYLASQSVLRNQNIENRLPSLEDPNATGAGLGLISTLLIAIIFPNHMLKQARLKDPGVPLTLPELYSPNILRFVLFGLTCYIALGISEMSVDMNFAYIVTGVILLAIAFFFPTQDRICAQMIASPAKYPT